MQTTATTAIDNHLTPHNWEEKKNIYNFSKFCASQFRVLLLLLKICSKKLKKKKNILYFYNGTYNEKLP